MKTLGIFGTSGHAREVGEIARSLGYKIFYIAENEEARHACQADESVILEAELNAAAVSAEYAIGIGENKARERVAERYLDRLEFPNLFHPSAMLDGVNRHPEYRCIGAVVFPGASVSRESRIGSFSVINRNASVSHDTVIGEFATVAPGANVLGNVSVGRRAWIGAGSTILQGRIDAPRIIGSDAMIGIGTVVLRDCEPGAAYVGNPARRLR